MSMTPPDQAGTANNQTPREAAGSSGVVGGFITASDLARGDKLFFGAGRAVRGAFGFLTVLTLFAAFGVAFTLEQIGERTMAPIYDEAIDCAYHNVCPMISGTVKVPRVQHHRPPAPPPTVSVAQYRASMLLRDRLLMAWQLSPWVVGAIAFPFFLWLFTSVFRGKPARVVVLNAPLGVHTDLRKMIRRELRPYGHVIAVVEAQRGVDEDARLRTRIATVRTKVAMNLRAFFARATTLAVRATPEWRAATTQAFARASDAVIVDLSIGVPADWGAIAQQASRCVFVSAWGRHEQAEAAFAALGAAGQCFFYAPDGEIQRRSQFRAAMLAAMRAAHA
jgi:hypothetical protein